MNDEIKKLISETDFTDPYARHHVIYRLRIAQMKSKHSDQWEEYEELIQKLKSGRVGPTK